MKLKTNREPRNRGIFVSGKNLAALWWGDVVKFYKPVRPNRHANLPRTGLSAKANTLHMTRD